MITCPHCKCTFVPNELTPSLDANRITPTRLIEMYNEYAIKHRWRKVVRPGEKLRGQLSKAIKELPELEMWTVVFRGWAADKWFNGSQGYEANIETMIFKARYMTFYNAGLAPEVTAKAEVSSFLDSLSSIATIGGNQ